MARWYREWARDFIAYPVPLTLPRVDAARWYRGRHRLPVPHLLLMVMVIGLCIAGIIQNPRTLALWLTGTILFCCPMIWLIVQSWRAGIGVTADHIIVRDIVRQDLIPWSSVTGFNLARPPHWHGQSLALYVVCADGRRLYSGGCAFDGWFYDRTLASARQMRHALELERRSHGETGPMPQEPRDRSG
jgi:hypothetical protein